MISVIAIRAAIVGDTEAALARMIVKADAKMTGHYEEIAQGAQKFIQRVNPTLVPVQGATWTINGLGLRVRHHVGLRLPDGRRMVVFLYMKQNSLTTDGAKAVWRVLEHAQSMILPDSSVAVLDVRRAKLVKPDLRVNKVKLDRWLGAEAAGYISHWHSATA